MMWRKKASETSEEGDDRMKEVVNDRQGAGRCNERRARPRVGVWSRHPRRREAPGQEDGDKRKKDISRQGVLSYEGRDMRQKLKDEDRGRKQPVAEKGGSQTWPKWAKMDGFGSKARPNLTA